MNTARCLFYIINQACFNVRNNLRFDRMTLLFP
jgi:hypothetical protein